jgi:hypothetical protein
MYKLSQNGHTYLQNKPNGPLIGNWYPKSRPLKIYRKQGKTSDTLVNLDDTDWLFNGINIHVIFGTFWYSGYGYVALQKDPTAFVIGSITHTLQSNNGKEAVWKKSDGTTVTWTSTSTKDVPCEPQSSYVKQYKMLGKILPGNKGPEDCCPNNLLDTNNGTIVINSRKGSIFSFSGRAQIRPASTLRSEKYFADTSQYLRSRGDSFQANHVLSKIQNVLYYEGDQVVWPIQKQTVDGKELNSSMFHSTSTQLSCENGAVTNTTIYKPSNSKYARQGAVTSAERILRLKTENPVVRMSMTGKKIKY